MPADALKCKECSTTYPLDARYVCERCFGPLEVAYRPPGGTPDELRRRIQAGPHTLWRYADFLPLEGSPGEGGPAGCLFVAEVFRPVGNGQLICAIAQIAWKRELDRQQVLAAAGTAPAALIRRKRLQQCHRALMDPGQSGRTIRTIAARWGFASQAHFTRLFRAAYGVPPGEFRASHSPPARETASAVRD